ncbi:MAG: hypothetical protein H6736_19395 [Alphaproteobacteria bacterium]|nr:hypothetical protein [Alphaproteobacteria bacterium]MCB9693978.1 hypothetical protein [Alphaproteobacteria bacterium]
MSWPEKTWHTQINEADASFEGKVTKVEATTEDTTSKGGVPVTHVTVTVVEQYSGATLPSSFIIVFPGGRFSEEVVYSYPDFPEPEVGDGFIAVVDHIQGDFFGLYNGPSSLIVDVQASAMTASGDVMVDFGCDQSHLIAVAPSTLPFQRVIEAEDTSDVGILRRVEPENARRIYTDTPRAHSLPWPATRAAARTCGVPAAQPAIPGGPNASVESAP